MYTRTWFTVGPKVMPKEIIIIPCVPYLLLKDYFNLIENCVDIFRLNFGSIDFIIFLMFKSSPLQTYKKYTSIIWLVSFIDFMIHLTVSIPE